jgi:hypothetical protein
VSHGTYSEIRDKLLEANYRHVFRNLGESDEVMVLGAIGLIPEKGCAMPSHHWDCTCDGMGGDR